MRILVNPEAMKGNAAFIMQKKEQSEDIINSMSKKIDLLKTYWQGKDAEVTLGKANNYVNNLKKNTALLEKYATLIKKTGTDYENIDKKFASQIRNIMEG